MRLTEWWMTLVHFIHKLRDHSSDGQLIFLVADAADAVDDATDVVDVEWGCYSFSWCGRRHRPSHTLLILYSVVLCLAILTGSQVSAYPLPSNPTYLSHCPVPIAWVLNQLQSCCSPVAKAIKQYCRLWRLDPALFSVQYDSEYLAHLLVACSFWAIPAHSWLLVPIASHFWPFDH